MIAHAKGLLNESNIPFFQKKFVLALTAFAIISAFAFGYFQQRNYSGITDCPELPEVPYKDEIPAKHVAFHTEIHPTAKIQVPFCLM